MRPWAREVAVTVTTDRHGWLRAPDDGLQVVARPSLGPEGRRVREVLDMRSIRTVRFALALGAKLGVLSCGGGSTVGTTPPPATTSSSATPSASRSSTALGLTTKAEIEAASKKLFPGDRPEGCCARLHGVSDHRPPLQQAPRTGEASPRVPPRYRRLRGGGPHDRPDRSTSRKQTSSPTGSW